MPWPNAAFTPSLCNSADFGIEFICARTHIDTLLGAEAATESVNAAPIRTAIDPIAVPPAGEGAMSAADYMGALAVVRLGRLRWFLNRITQAVDSMVATRSMNAVLERDLQQARQDMDRVARLLEADASLHRANLSTAPAAQGRKVYY
jgi:hypothetical protein